MKNALRKSTMLSLLLSLGFMVGCDEDSTGPSKEESSSSSEKVSSSSNPSNSSSSSEVSSSSDEVSSSSELPTEPTLITLENSIYDYEVYVDLSTGEIEAIEAGLWDVEKNGHSGFVLNSAYTQGLVVLEKTLESISLEDTTSFTEEKTVGTLAGESVAYDLENAYLLKTSANEWITFAAIYNSETHLITFDFKNLTTEAEGEIDFDKERLSFESKSSFDAKPENWDLYFGPYRTLLESGSEYSVKGTLINSGVSAVLDSTKTWKEITSAVDYDLSDEIAAIGHTWKSYNYEEKTYDVKDNYLYLVQTEEGKSYKLKFLSFNDGEGTRGYPQFQFIELP